MSHIDSAARDRIRELNNAFRRSFDRSKGLPVLTAGVASLPSDVQAMAIRKVATFDIFDEDNDPHGEHDFGAFETAGQRFFWKSCYTSNATAQAVDNDGATNTGVASMHTVLLRYFLIRCVFITDNVTVLDQ